MAPDNGPLLKVMPPQDSDNRPPEEPLEPFVLLQNLPTLLLLGIFGILFLGVLYVARELAMPVVLAFILSAMLQPVMRLLARIHVPKMLSALLIVVTLCGALVALSIPLTGPAVDWLSKAPTAVVKLEEWVDLLRTPIRQMERVSEGVGKLAESTSQEVVPVTVKEGSFGTILFSGTRAVFVGLFTTMLLLFFLLIAGDLFLRRLVEVLPNFSDKKQAVEISREIELGFSQYMLTITIMNTIVGVATAAAVWLCGLSDPLLWGTVAFLLNYIPIIGPLACAAILFLASLLTFDSVWFAMLPPAIYLGIHLSESDWITPLLLARRFTLNPVLIIIAIMFWYGMWGMAGAFLAVPMLASLKIVCDRVAFLTPIGHFIAGNQRD